MSNASIVTFSGLASGLDTTGIIQKMTQVAQQPIQNLQAEEITYNIQLAAWQDFNTRLTLLQTSATSLSQASTFNATTATASNTAIASITAQPGAVVGDHSLIVTQLAQAQKVISKSFTNSNVPLGESGSFTLNGKTITINATDALADVAVKINSAKAGVNATLINTGANSFQMTLTSNATGTANAISAADSGTDKVLADLGLISGTAAVRQTVTPTGQTGAAALALGSATQAVGTILGAASGSAASGTIHIQGSGTGAGSAADVAINLNTDSLNDIANKINAAGITGITAEVVALPDANGNISAASQQQLQILSAGTTAPAFTDSNNVLTTLGVLQVPASTVPGGDAKDAQFSLDGISMTRSSNVISDIIPNATVKLLSAGTPASGSTPAAPGTTTLSVTQNTDSVVQAVNSFVSAYNNIQDFVTQQNQFTAPTTKSSGAVADSPPLFGNSTVSQIQSQVSQALSVSFGNTSLANLGVTMDAKGHLNVDTGTLTQALQNNPGQAASLFGLSGTADDPNVRFVAAGPKTQGTAGAGYPVAITTPATQSSSTAGVAQTSKSTAPETLTFTGALFPSAVKITLAAGNTLQDTVNQINSNGSLNGLIYAGINSSGALTLTSQQYGSTTGFAVGSDQAAAATTSGIGTSATVTTGTDVAGTINGEPATGKGRTLTGNAGNARTEGLQLLVTATAAGSYGHIAISHGIADTLGGTLKTILDPVNGSIISAENSIHTQISDAEQEIQKVQDSVSSYSDYLTQMFSAMETRISELQSQGSAFAAQVAGLGGISTKK